MLISDFIDQKLEEFLTIHAPDEMQKLKIQKLEAELLEANEALREIEFMMKMRRQQQTKVRKEEEIPDNSWLEKYELSKDSIATQINRKLIDWKVVVANWGFKDVEEAREKVTTQLSKDHLLGCHACKKWKSKTSYCSFRGKSTDLNDSCMNWEKR